MEKIVIIGGGSFICNLINYIESMNKYEIVGYTDKTDNGNFWDVKYLGTDEILEELYAKGIHKAALAIGNRLSDTTIKQTVFNKIKKIGYELPIIIGNQVVIHKGVQIGEGSIIRDGAILQSKCKLGKAVMIGDRAIISHDTVIDDFSQVVSGCILGKNLHIGKTCFFGFGAIISNNIKITDGCTIGAQSFVNKDCEIKGLYFGQPAKIVKKYE